MDQPKRFWWVLAGVLCLLAAATFGSLAELGLDNHDRDNFLDSAAISQDFSYLFANDKHHPSGRPLYELLIWAGYALWGQDTRLFHLLGVVWHLGAALLLARLCLRLGWEWRPSAAAALLFFYQVSHFRAVHWISAQCYILSFMLLVGGLWAYLDWSERSSRRGAYLFYGCLVGGMLVHTATAALVPLSGALAWSRGQPLRPAMARLAPAGLAALLVGLAIRAYYINAPQVGQLGAAVDAVDLMRSLLYMAGRLLSTAHSLRVPLFEPSVWDWGAGVLVLGGCGFLLWRRCFWGAWIPLTLAPYLVLAPEHVLGLQAGPSRYIYVASAGVAALAGLGMARLARIGGVGLWGYAPLLVLVPLSHVELKRAESVSYYISGRCYVVLNQGQKAIASLEEALRICPECIPLEDTYGRIFNTRLILGQGLEPELTRAREQLPQSRVIALLVAVMATETQGPTALEAVDRLIDEQRSDYDLRATAAVFFANRGRALVQADSAAKAVTLLRHALRYDPQQSTALKSIAFLLAKKGDLRQAGEFWYAGGDHAKAIKAWRAALAADPQDRGSRLDLARALSRAERLDEALEEYQVILAAGSNMTAHFEAGLLHLRRGDDAAARRSFSLFVEDFGTDAARQAGLVEKLVALSTRLERPTGRQILEEYWPVD